MTSAITSSMTSSITAAILATALKLSCMHCLFATFSRSRSDDTTMDNFMSTAVFDLDLDNGTLSTDVPALLRAILNRTLNGGLFNKKSASERVIKSLKDLPLLSILEKECPICYELFEEKSQKNPKKPNTCPEKVVGASREIKNLLLKMNDKSYQFVEDAQQFDDPSLFFPDDEVASSHTRFPMRNIITLEEPSLEQILPGSMTREDKLKQQINEAGHTPVKMPSCEHIFGRACIIQWLKSSVTCPLCRSEVEVGQQSDSRVRKAEELRDTTQLVFNDQDNAIDHLANHLTNVFYPYRRPYAPQITSLTDSFIPQAIATPSRENAVGCPEPELVIPRPFPIGEGPILVSHTVPVAAVSTDENSPRGAWPWLRNLQPPSANRGGGPDRSRRSPLAQSRSHPYTRPDERQ